MYHDSNDSYRAVLSKSCVTQDVASLDRAHDPVFQFIPLGKLHEYVDKIVKCNHPTESYRILLFCGVVHYDAQGGSESSKDENFPRTILDYSVPCG